jgi:hypothetical protein
MFKTFKEYQDHIQNRKDAFEKNQEQNLKDYWNNLKPFVKAEDIPDIPRVTRQEYEDFYMPRLIELGAIPKNQLRDGVWYYGNYRNARLGKWNDKTNKFDHYRYKFHYMHDTCNHFEDDDGYALFVPIREANDEELKEIKDIENGIKK